MRETTRTGKPHSTLGSQACAVAAAAIAIAAAAGHLSGREALTSFGPGLNALAPLTILMVLTLSAGLLLGASPGARELPGRVARALGGMALLLSLVVVVIWTLPDANGWSSVAPFGLAPKAVSPPTAVAMAMVGLGLVLLFPSGPRRLRRQIAALPALVSVGIALFILFTYLAGSPALYGTTTVPMSLPAAIAALLLGSGTILAAGPDIRLAGFFVTDTLPGTDAARLFRTAPFWIFLAIALAIWVGGGLLLRQTLDSERADIANQLSIVAEHDVGQIRHWMEERSLDARVASRTRLVRDRLRHDRPRESDSHVQELLESHLGPGGCRRIVLYDRDWQAAAVASEPGDLRPIEGRPGFPLRPGPATFSAPYLAADGLPHLDVVVPVREDEPPGSTPAGFMVFDIDPRKSFFPLIQSWSGFTPTAETLLVRPDGNEVVFLNELRHRKGTAMRLRFPLGPGSSLPAARAAVGEEGTFEGIDYRGVPVLAATRLIRYADVDWAIVSKVDAREALGPLRQVINMAGLGMLAALLATGLAVGHLAREQQARLERRTRALGERFRNVMRQAGEGILLSTPEGRILEANDKVCEQHGYAPGELAGRNLGELDAMRDEPNAVSPHDREDGRPFERMHRRADGSTFSAEVASSLVDIDDQAVRVSFVRDVSERNRERAEFLRMHELLGVTGEMARVGGWRIDLGSGALAWTDEVYRIHEVAPGYHPTLETAIAFYSPESVPVISAAVEKAIAEGEPFDLELELVTARGRRLWVRALGHAVRRDGVAVEIVGAFQDIDELVKARTERQNLLEQLERKNRDLESMIYAASHDLRSPLINVQGFARNLRGSFEKIRERMTGAESVEALRTELHPILSEKIPAALRFIEAGSARMDALIGGLLQLSRAGRPAGSVGPVDVDELVRELRDSMQTQIAEAGTEIEIRAPLVRCLGERVRLGQVFANLLDNALKYRDSGRPLRVSISSRVEGTKAIYQVTDSGVGIAAENLGRIWELFRRLDPIGSVTGEGLGLTLARRIVEGFGGRILVNSQPGVGSEFVVELRAAC